MTGHVISHVISPASVGRGSWMDVGFQKQPHSLRGKAGVPQTSAEPHTDFTIFATSVYILCSGLLNMCSLKQVMYTFKFNMLPEKGQPASPTVFTSPSGQPHPSCECLGVRLDSAARSPVCRALGFGKVQKAETELLPFPASVSVQPRPRWDDPLCSKSSCHYTCFFPL